MNAVETTWTDLRYALRALRKTPGFTLVAGLTLALGVGANTAMFSVVNAVLIRPLPYRNAGQLVQVTGTLRALNLTNVGLSVPELDDLREDAGVFHQISPASPENENLTEVDRPERLELMVVSTDYFELLGAEPQLGRVFRAEGLQVVVDGTTITTPQRFTWDLNSTHTLDIPAGAQTLGGTVYTYGRWSDDPAVQHTITIAPGNGALASPAASPATTMYLANFIELVQFSSSVFPASSGTVVATPLPSSFPPAPGLYYAARQPVSLQATPNAGFNFHGWIGPPGAMSRNPRPTRGPATVQARFTASPVTTISASLPERWVWVDGSFSYAPRNFALPYDPTWTSGSTHTVDIMISPQLPYSINSRYAFASWSDGGARSHSITVPPTSSTLTANFTAQYVPIGSPNQGCAGTVTLSPSSPDGFYSAGTMVTFTETTNTGWTFTGWQVDLSGVGNPQSLVVNDELLAKADFNTADVPLRVSALTPPSATAGDADFTLTIDGAGFTPDTIALVGGVFRAPTFVNSTQLTLPIFAADVAAAGAFQVGISNFPEGAVCSAFVGRPFTVLSPM